MKGVVFNLLQEVVIRAHGADTWDALLEAAALEGSYTSLGSYPDDHMIKLVGAASKALKVEPGEVLRWFGREAMPSPLRGHTRATARYSKSLTCS
jgi:Haem-NO-binding